MYAKSLLELVCDGDCSARALRKFRTAGGEDLQFCGHHANRFEAGLIGAGFSEQGAGSAVVKPAALAGAAQ